MFHGHHTWCFCWPNLHFTIELANQKVAKPLRRLKIDTPNGLFMFISLKHSRTLSISEHTYIYIYIIWWVVYPILHFHAIIFRPVGRSHFSMSGWTDLIDQIHKLLCCWSMLKHDLITLLNTSIFVGYLITFYSNQTWLAAMSPFTDIFQVWVCSHFNSFNNLGAFRSEPSCLIPQSSVPMTDPCSRMVYIYANMTGVFWW